MKINRQQFLGCLDTASLAISARGVIDQSNCLIFKNGRLLTYDGDVRIDVPGIDGVAGAIPSAGLIDLVKKIPDAEIEVRQESDGELIIEGKNKKAAIRSEQSIVMDLSDIPIPTKWGSFRDGIMNHIRRAAETCGVDDTWGAATCVHITKDLIEASDNFRLFRWEGKTGFREEIFLPAHSIYLLSDFAPTEFAAAGDGAILRPMALFLA